MRVLYQLAALFRALFRSERVDADLADEMRFHVERETEANIARGMSPEAAHRAARLTFGSIDASHESSRDDRPGVGLRQLLTDVRFGTRLLVKAPVFALTAVVIIALGIGAPTAIFSVVYGVMLRPLPFHEPDRLVSIWLVHRQGRSFPTAADAAELRQLRGVFNDVALVRSANMNLSLVGDGDPQRLQAARVSPNFFAVLGVAPALGRGFATDEDQAGREHVIVLSHALWRSRFGAERSVIGRQVRLDGNAFTVVGVMPPDVQYPTTALDAWIPAVLEPGELARTVVNNYRLVARLDHRTSLLQARGEATALARRLGNAYHPMTWSAGADFTVDAMLDDVVDAVRPALRLLLGAVSLLLIIACVNLSTLFGARATARRSEFAVRRALGASRARLVAQAIAEAVPVLAIGGALGVVVAQWAVHAFVASAPAGLPRVESIALNGPVIGYSLVLLVLTGIAASIAPALQAWHSDFTTSAKDISRSSTAGRARSTVRRIGVAAQVAFALPLLIGASLLIQSAIAVGRVQLGFVPERVSTLAFEVSRRTHESDAAVGEYHARLVEAVRAVPGVSNAAITNRIPLVGAQTNPVHFDHPTGPAEDETEVDSRTVTPEYFATLGIPLIAGRTFSDHDGPMAPLVGIIDEQIARTIWPGEPAVGKRFRGPDARWGTIVGVVGHVRTAGLEVDPHSQVYWSTRQWAQNRAVLALRSGFEPSALYPAIIKAIRSIDPDQSVFDMRPMEEIVARSLAHRRATTRLMIAFGAIALLLAAVGIYGVVAYGVAQRLREFGIRVALGATPREITGVVLWQGTSMALAGALVGLALALIAAGVMSNLVYGVPPRDVVSVVGAMALVLLVAGAASYVPARRAAAVDPAVALRTE